MFKNYLKVTLRSFVNQKYYSIINTLGLALGLAACIVILLFVQDELSYEKAFDNHDQIYRLVQDFPMGDHLSQSASVPFPTKNTMAEDFPSIKETALAYRPSSWGQSPLMKHNEDEFYEDDFIYAENSFLKIFELEFVKGDPSTALLEPNQLLVSESIAKKYFGDEDPIGKRINLNRFRDLEVIGVIKELPHNTHLKFNMIGSLETLKTFFGPNTFDSQWVWVAAWLYFTVEDPNDAARIGGQLDDFVARHYPQSLVDKGVKLKVQEADKIHLYSSRELEFKANGNIQHVYIFSSIAVLILVIAIINFMNLATSRSAKRGKEVGLRKAMGANKEMLVTQFMGEAVITTFFSLVIALLLIYNILPWYNDLTGKNITMHLFQNPILLLGLVILLIVVGILAGSYPSLILSAFNPTEVLKGRIINTSGVGDFLRKGLVISQFVVSISLIICIGIVYKQLNYIHTTDLGFSKEQILLADVNFNQQNHYEPFKNTLEANTDIKGVTLMGGSIPGQEELIENAFVESGTPVDEQQWFSAFFAAHDFEKVINLEFLQGHSFKVGSSVDSAGFIINEAAAKALGWENEDVIGRSMDRINSSNGNIIQTGTVIGLVKDYHYRPLYDPIKPLVIILAQGGAKLVVKMQSKNLRNTMSFIEETWKSEFEGIPFRYTFMDEDYDHLYEKEEKMSRIVQYFSILAIFIACLGLLGLSSFSTENRKKEIGIRKVNGATTVELLTLLTKDFSKLVLFAFIISIPVSYYFGNLWLNDFAYRTSIGVDVFLIAGLSAFLIAILTVSYHTVKAAIKNPVTSLRYE